MRHIYTCLIIMLSFLSACSTHQRSPSSVDEKAEKNHLDYQHGLFDRKDH